MMKLVKIAGAPVVGVLLSIALFFQARGMDEIAQPGQLGPSFWPRMILVGLALACAAKLIVDVRSSYAGVDTGVTARPPISRTKLFASIGLILLYMILAPVIGFALATAGFIAGFMWVSGSRSIPMIVGNMAVGTVLLLYVFVKFVYLPLPKGDWVFEVFTLALYRALHLF
jgi:putative tricarboxylic transport membrane protein